MALVRTAGPPRPHPLEGVITLARLRLAARLVRTDGLGIARTVGLMATIRAALWIAPFPAVYSALQRRRQRQTRNDVMVPLPRLLHRVHVASRIVPRASCLVQSLTAEQLLTRSGHRTRLRFGVAGDSGAPLSAHAWVECDGRVVVGGGPGLADFTPLPPLV